MNVSSFRRHPVIDGALVWRYRNGENGRPSPAALVNPCRRWRNPVADLLFVLLIVAAFAPLALALRGVEKL